MSADVSIPPFQSIKSRGVCLGRGDKGVCVCAGWCAENGVTLAGGLLWLPNAASVAAAVALLCWSLTADSHHTSVIICLVKNAARTRLFAHPGCVLLQKKLKFAVWSNLPYVVCGGLDCECRTPLCSICLLQVCACAWVGLSGNSRTSLERVTPTPISTTFKSQGFKAERRGCAVCKTAIILKKGWGIKTLCLLRTSDLQELRQFTWCPISIFNQQLNVPYVFRSAEHTPQHACATTHMFFSHIYEIKSWPSY